MNDDDEKKQDKDYKFYHVDKNIENYTDVIISRSNKQELILVESVV